MKIALFICAAKETFMYDDCSLSDHQSESVKPLQAEHKLRQALPETLEVCDRCHRGIMVYLGAGDGPLYERSDLRDTPWCYTCGNKTPGVRYLREGGQGATVQADLPHLRVH